MTNYKTFKIINISIPFEIGGWIRFELDDDINYLGFTANTIDCSNRSPFNNYHVGNYLEIDLDKTYHEDVYHTFNDTNIVRKTKVSPSTNVITARGSSSDVVISPSVVNSMGSSQATELARYMSRMVDETDKEFELKIEDNNNPRFTYSLICRKQK